MNKTTEVIKSCFDKQKWQYDLKEADDNGHPDEFNISFYGENEGCTYRVLVCFEGKSYQLVGFTQTSVPQQYMDGALKAVNEYNCAALLIGSCIGQKGRIIFWSGRNVVSETFSEEVFMKDFRQLVIVVEDDTAQILKNALKLSDSKPRKGILSFLSKK